MGWKIDEIDRKILELLRESANMPNEKIGKKVGLSEPAARRRVANLVTRGVIKRFTIDVEEGGGVSALVFIATSPHCKIYPSQYRNLFIRNTTAQQECSLLYLEKKV